MSSLSKGRGYDSGFPRGPGTTFTLPWRYSLAGFTELSTASEGLDLGALTARDRIYLRTHNNDYQIVLTDPATRRVTVQGGSLFAQPTEAVIHGSTCGGAMLRIGWIGIGFQLELVYHPAHDEAQSVVTSPVKHLFIERTEP